MEKFKNLISPKEAAHPESGWDDEGWDINDMLSYELIRKDEIWIHIDDVRELPLATKLKLLRDGFRELANILKTNPVFKDVKTVSGLSWIVAKNSKLVRSLGFDITKDMSGLEDQLRVYERRKDEEDLHLDIAPAYAYMGKEKFLSLYGDDVIEKAA